MEIFSFNDRSVRGQRRYATHRVVEELLEFLVSVVDTELLKTVQIEDFETRNVQNSDETKNICSIKLKSFRTYNVPCSLSLGPVQRLVDPGADPLEEPLVGCFANGLHSELDLLLALGLGHIVSTNWK